MDSRNVLVKLADGRKFVFAMLVIAIGGALVALGKASYAEFVSLVKYIGVAFIVATGVEGIGAKAEPSTPEQKP
jgi:hypothetical protein